MGGQALVKKRNPGMYKGRCLHLRYYKLFSCGIESLWKTQRAFRLPSFCISRCLPLLIFAWLPTLSAQIFIYLFIYNIRLEARQNPILMNNKLKGCPKTPNKIKKGTDRKMTKSNKENGKLNWTKQNKMRQTKITQDGNQQPS